MLSTVTLATTNRSSLDETSAGLAAICDRAAEHGLLAHIELLPFGGIPDLNSARSIGEAADRPNGCLTIDSWHLDVHPLFSARLKVSFPAL